MREIKFRAWDKFNGFIAILSLVGTYLAILSIKMRKRVETLKLYLEDLKNDKL